MRTYTPLTYDCNDNCISCPVPRKKERKNPSLKEIYIEIDKIKKYSEHIELNGGEPTLNKDLLKILNYIKNKNFKETSLLSNCQTFYNENNVKKILKVPNLKIITTLYGHNKNLQDSITRNPGSFERKIKGIENLIKYKIPIELRILLQKKNYNEINEIIKFTNQYKLNKIIILNPKLTACALKNIEYVGEKISIISKKLSYAIKLSNNKNIELYHFPHCILPHELWQYSKGQTSIKGEICFIEECNGCSKQKVCSGIWCSYLNKFGKDEFKKI